MIIRCPYCLNNVTPKIEPGKGYYCSVEECSEGLPKKYVEEDIPKVTVGLVGFTGHGKTVYLTALFYLFRILARKRTWEDFTWQTSDDHTHKIMFEHVRTFRESRLPESTPANFPKPALIELQNIPFFGDMFLSFYDTAGGVYERAEMITDMARFVAYSEVVLFVISLKESGMGEYGMEEVSNEMMRLLNTYIRGASDKLHVNLKNQHLIVLLSKADMVEFSEELQSLLYDGSYDWWKVNKNAEDMKDKLKQLKETSKKIEKWLREKECGGFVNLAKNSFKSVEYVILSSTGAKPVGDELATKLDPTHPKRVIDPTCWTMEKIRKKSIWEIIFG